MNKHLPPPLKMKVERGRLVPATQYDSERLDSYRVGSTVNVRFTADRVRPLERKYRAILGKVVKECETPWSNAEAAHQAIKLACGIVNYGKTAGNDFFQWPRSLVDLDDKEMEEFFESAMGVIQDITGIDPETLKRESANVGDEDEHIDPLTGEITNTNPGDQSPPDQPADDATAQTAALSQEPSKDSSPDDGSNEESAVISPTPGAAAGSSSLLPEDTMSNVDRSQLIDCFAKLMAIPLNDELDGPAKRRTLASAKDDWKSILPAHLHPQLASMFYSVDGVIKGHDRDKAINEFAYFLGCTPEELGG